MKNLQGEKGLAYTLRAKHLIQKILKTIKKNIVDKENSEVKKLMENERALHMAMHNAFLLITGRKSYEDFENLEGFWLPEGFHELESIDNIMEYYIEKEDYEKCAELRDIKAKIARKEATNNLSHLFKTTQWKIDTFRS